MFCWVGAGRIERKLNNVGGESKSPIEMKNRDESGDPRIVHRRARWKSLIQQYIFLFEKNFFYVYDDVVLLYYLLFFLGDDRTPLKFCNFGFYFL